MTEICFTPARKLASLIRSRKLSATEVMKAFIAQIERVNPKGQRHRHVPARIKRSAQAKATGQERRAAQGILAGLPIAFKDLVPTKGIRTTLWLAWCSSDNVAQPRITRSSSGSPAPKVRS